MPALKNSRVALLATSGFEQSELEEPLRFLKDAGATVHVVALERGSIRGWNHGEWADEFEVDHALDQVAIDDYDALVLPGGVINPDKLRRDPKAVDFVREFVESGKPVAAICHGPWMLIEAGVIDGRRSTSFFSIRTDMENAGADWVDEKVVIDGNLITSRNPDDIPDFNDAIAAALAERVEA